MPPPNEPIAVSVALVASFTVTIPVRRLALRVGMVDHPGPRKVHRAPNPLLGGLAISCAVLLASVVAWRGTVGADGGGHLGRPRQENRRDLRLTQG